MEKTKKKKKVKTKEEPIKFVTCTECGNEQADMGRNVACEQCGYGPMPSYP
jgi:hypothetical protein